MKKSVGRPSGNTFLTVHKRALRFDSRVLMPENERGTQGWSKMPDADPRNASTNQELQRLAMGLALQLPMEEAEALVVLGHLQNIVKWQRGAAWKWLDDEGPPRTMPAEVVEFRRA